MRDERRTAALSPAQRSRWSLPAAQVLCVYRRANACRVARALAPVTDGDTLVRLWALDETAEHLDRWTVGTGPGGRFALINAMRIADPDRYLVVLDDDVEFRRGDLADLLRIAHRLGLELAQPAHARDSHAHHPITRAVRGLLARRTTFVEIGPVTVVAPCLLDRVTPFPERTPMGHGVDLEWTRLAVEGHSLGIVDAVRIVHAGRLFASYADGAIGVERAASRAALDAWGAEQFAQLQVTVREIRRSHRAPAARARRPVSVPHLPRPLG